jgi:hypothetical protein
MEAALRKTKIVVDKRKADADRKAKLTTEIFKQRTNNGTGRANPPKGKTS